MSMRTIRTLPSYETPDTNRSTWKPLATRFAKSV